MHLSLPNIRFLFKVLLKEKYFLITEKSIASKNRRIQWCWRFIESLTVDSLSTIVLRTRPCNKYRAMTALVHSEASPTRGIIQSPALTRLALP